jgi:acyl dehydratase
VRAGDRLSVVVEDIESRRTASGRLVSTYRWEAVDQNGTTVAQTRAVMLRRAPEELPEEPPEEASA